MKTTIGFNELQISCIIGDLAYERVQEQEVLVTLEVSFPFSNSDQLQDTVDYVSLANLCKQIAVNGKFQLLETLANEIVDQIFSRFTVHDVSLLIKKPGGLKDAKSAFVTIKKELS